MKEYLTAEELSDALSVVSPQTIRALALQGKIPHEDDGGTCMFDLPEIDSGIARGCDAELDENGNLKVDQEE